MKEFPLTEQQFSKKKSIDNLPLIDALSLMIDEQKMSVIVLNEILDVLELTVEKVVMRLKNSKTSRLIYVGAGTSGRIGVQDGVELYPTFGWPFKRLDFIIAGGIEALIKPIEGAEDDVKKAQLNFKKAKIKKEDIVFGLSASGNTPFTCEILKLSKQAGALTIAISNNHIGKILNFGQLKLILNTRQEVVAGSTRLKAGTSQKICLNIISTMVMTKLGFVKNGMMVNLQALNRKLKKRKLHIQNILNTR